jgi:ankyrin repeat protein
MNAGKLARAVCEGSAKLVSAAINGGANVNARYRGRPVLFWAIQEGHVNFVRLLVGAGASLKRRDDSGFSALDLAVGGGDVAIVSFLLKSGADVNGQTANGSPLHTTCAYRHVKIARLLLENGADPLEVDDEGRTPSALMRLGKPSRHDARLRALLTKARRAHAA